MAKKKKQMEGPSGPAPWMATFSDLMNLLLCFFVLLFSMSTVNEEKFQMVIASLQSSMSIFQNGSLSIGDGDLVGAGIRQLEFLDSYYNANIILVLKKKFVHKKFLFFAKKESVFQHSLSGLLY